MRPMIERIAAEQPAAFRNLVFMGAETSELPQVSLSYPVAS
jgi:hypothetical protein